MHFGHAINGDTKLGQLVGGNGHTRTDEFDGRITVDGLDRTIGGKQFLEDSEEHNHQQGTKEDVNRALALGGNLLIERRSVAAVDILALSGVGDLLLELGILVKVLSALVRGDGCHDDTRQTGGNGYHEHLRDGNVVAIGSRDGDKGYHSRRDGRAGDTNLGSDTGDTARTLGADALLDRDVADDGHERVNHVTCADEHRQEESAQRGEEGDAVGVLAQHLLGQLDQPVHTARGLHDAGAGDGGDDDVNHVGGRGAGFHTEAKHENCQADARDGT